jgi:hypothetical protein
MKTDGRSTRHQAKRDLVVNLFRELGSIPLVAEEMQMSQKMVGYHLKKQRIPIHKQERFDPNSACEKNAEKVLTMCEDGMSLQEMAQAVGTTGVSVKRFLRRHGVTREFPTTKEGERHYAWKGRLVDKDGYVLIHVKGHPNARKHTPYIFEHRLVMEESLGRFLAPDEVVHHINGVKDDNRIENLQLFENNAAHLAVDLKGRCPKWSDEGKERIREALRRRWSAWRASNQTKSEVGDPPCI